MDDLAETIRKNPSKKGLDLFWAATDETGALHAALPKKKKKGGS